MKLLLFCLLTLTNYANASFFESFGASSSSLASAGQSADTQDMDVNYYHPSMVSGLEKLGYSFSFSHVETQFKTMDNVVVLSPVNSNKSSEVYNDVDPNPSHLNLLTGHGAFEFFPELGIRLGLSFVVPSDKIYESATLDTYLPEYVNYKTRLNRPMFSFNFSKSISEYMTSIGLIASTKASGSAQLVATENGSAQKSSGNVDFSAAPVTAPIISVARKFSNWTYSLTYQRYMRSKIETDVDGYTPIGASSLAYSLNLQATLYFDPTTVRMSATHKWDRYNFLATLEYQDWREFEAPILTIKNTGGIIQGSTEYQESHGKQILVPKLAFGYAAAEKHKFTIGALYRPSAIESDLDTNGTLIDPNTYSLSFGETYQYSKLTQFTVGLNYTHIIEESVNKSSNREDGTAGEKIGAPGYEISGDIFVLSFGLNWLI